MSSLAMGVDLGGTNARAAVVDRDTGEIVAAHKEPHRERTPGKGSRCWWPTWITRITWAV